MDSEMAINPRSLHREIVCPVCLEVLNQTRAAPDCLHRFCKGCVEKIAKKECPVCHKKLPSQAKSFREDTKFDQLISRIHAGYQANKPSDGISRSVQPLECEIVLKNLDGTQTRYLKCPDNTTVGHLARYLAIRPENSKMPNLENDEEYKLSLAVDKDKGIYHILEASLKLSDIKAQYNPLNASGPLELYFHNKSGA